MWLFEKSVLYQFLICNCLTAFSSGLCKPEDIIDLHPQRLNSTSCEEVVDHPRARGGDVKGSVCAESQPLPGVPLWRPSADSIQGQCLPLTDDCKPLLGFIRFMVTVSSDWMHPVFCCEVCSGHSKPPCNILHHMYAPAVHTWCVRTNKTSR